MVDGIKQCDAFSGIDRDYCIALSQSCIDQGKEGKSPIVLDLLNGKTEDFRSASQCLSYAKYRASLGAPKGFSATPPRQPPAPAPADSKKDKAPPKKGGSASKKKEPAGNKPEPPKPAPAEHAAYSKCDSVGPESSSEYEYCRQLIGICIAGDGPYSLPFHAKQNVVRGQRECLGLALYYAKLSGSGQTPARTASGPADASAGGWKPDGQTRLATTFHDAGFEPKKSDGIQLESLTIPFYCDPNVRGIKVAMAYRLLQNDANTYTIRYHIYREKARKLKDLSDSDLDMSFTFRTTGDVIDGTLAFGATLYNEGNFGSLSSIEIVKLD